MSVINSSSLEDVMNFSDEKVVCIRSHKYLAELKNHIVCRMMKWGMRENKS